MPAQLPVMLDFGGNNPDGFSLDQSDDDVLHISGWMEHGELNIEVWGNTTLLVPTGERHEVRRFQQVSTITPTGDDTFDWAAVRSGWVDVPWAAEHQPAQTTDATADVGSQRGAPIGIRYVGREWTGPSFFQEKIEFRASGTSEDVDHFVWFGALGQRRPDAG